MTIRSLSRTRWHHRMMSQSGEGSQMFLSFLRPAQKVDGSDAVAKVDDVHGR